MHVSFELDFEEFYLFRVCASVCARADMPAVK